MRNPGLLLLSTLAACAASPPGVDPEWRQIQAGRLERLHQPRHPAEAVAAAIAQDPKPAAGRRTSGHIDQREPAGARRFLEPRVGWLVDGSVGYGSVAARVKGTQLDDRADATFLHLGVESGKGTAVHAEAWSSETELFAGRRFNDGVDPVDAAASLRGVQVFPHLRIDGVRRGDFSMPMRLGMVGDWQRLGHRASVEREWLSLGPRLVLEPTLRLLGDDSGWLEVLGRLGGDVGATWFSEEYRGGDDHDVTSRWSTDVGIGLRGHIGRMQAELGYELDYTNIGSTDSDLLGNRSKTEMQRQQLFFGLGLKF